MRRKRQHQSNFNRLLRNERTVPRIACLMELLSRLEDSETDEDRALYKEVVLANYGFSSRSIRWRDGEDPNTGELFTSRHDQEAEKEVKAKWDEVISGKKPEAKPAE